MTGAAGNALDTCGCEPRASDGPVVFNRPGLPALDYRIGTHASFLHRMLLGIASWSPPEDDTSRPLAPLTTRSTGDPAVALLDAWAMVGDVLTFYQERIANEGFLRTATERRSILELARTIGYELNPGVAASAYLAFEVEGRFVVEDRSPLGLGPPPTEAIVAAGTKVQSIPGQDELPQTFETSADLKARADWNVMRPRQTLPQPVSLGSRVLYIAGIATGFVRGDRVLITAPRTEQVEMHRARAAAPGHDPVAPHGDLPGFELPTTRVDAPGVDVSILNVLSVQPEPEHGRTRLDLDVLPKLPPAAQPPAPTISQPAANPAFDPPAAPEVPDVAPADLADPVMVLVPRPLTEQEILDRILAYAWTDAQLAAQAAIQWWNLDALAAWIRHATGGPDLSPVFEYVQVAPQRDVTRPTVLKPFPDDGAHAVHPNTPVTVTFSEPMDGESAKRAVTLVPEDTRLPVPAVAKEYQPRTATVKLTLQGDLLATNARYLIKVSSTEATDANGLPLGADVQSSFTVADYAPPAPPAVTPTDGKENVPALTSVTATFAEPVNHVDRESFFLRDAAGTRVPAYVRAEDDKKKDKWILTPRAPLALSTRYTATLTQAITDIPASGSNDKENPIAVHEWEFTTAIRDAHVPARELRVYGFREHTGFFGHNAPKWSSLPTHAAQRGTVDPYESSWDDPGRTVWGDSQGSSLGGDSVLLDREVQDLEPNSWAIFETEKGAAPYYVGAVSAQSVADFGISGRASRLQLSLRDGSSPSQGKVTPATERHEETPLLGPADFRVRETAAHVRSELLSLVELPVEEPLAKGSTAIVLSTMVLGLAPDRVIALRGEQLELPGVYANELLVLDEAIHAAGFTTLKLRHPLERSYVRRTVTMNANVVVATHGETVAREILGGGDGAQANQRFTLRRPPLTHVSANTPSGAVSTLEVRVDDVLWDETPVLYGLGPRSRRYIVRVDDDGKPSIIFGDGARGARPPTGVDNVVARYRSGIGMVGMVGSERLSLMRERPLGIASVTNPLAALGAAEPESRDDARVNAPLTVLTMERIVSLRDFEDFARGFAGIGKAQAIAIWRGATHQVHVTVAAADGSVLPPTAPLFKNLRDAVDAARDPGVAVAVDSFSPRYFDLAASLRIDPAYLAADVLASARAAVLDRFSFARRSFGQPVTAAEVVEVAQGVPGVVATYLHGLELTSEKPERIRAAVAARRLRVAARLVPDGAPVALAPAGAEPVGRPLEQVLFAYRARLVGDRIVPAELLVINPGALSLKEHAR